MLVPLVGQCRPKGKAPLQDLPRTFEAVLWRHQNGAEWRSVAVELGPWWRATQTFIRWVRPSVWEHLLSLVQERGIQFGVAFLDGTSVHAHQANAALRSMSGKCHEPILGKRH